MRDQTALLILDVQNGLFSSSEFYIYHSEELIKNIKTLISKARESGVRIIYTKNTEEHTNFVPGNPAWEIHPELAPQEVDVVFEKKSPDAFYKTPLSTYLQQENIKYLIITGLQTEGTIDTTCRQAFSLGYNNILVRDAHSTSNLYVLTPQEIIEHHHRIMASWFAELMNTEEIDFG